MATLICGISWHAITCNVCWNGGIWVRLWWLLLPLSFNLKVTDFDSSDTDMLTDGYLVACYDPGPLAMSVTLILSKLTYMNTTEINFFLERNDLCCGIQQKQSNIICQEIFMYTPCEINQALNILHYEICIDCFIVDNSLTLQRMILMLSQFLFTVKGSCCQIL